MLTRSSKWPGASLSWRSFSLAHTFQGVGCGPGPPFNGVSADASNLRSKVALGRVLEQEKQGMWGPLVFYSNKMSPAETRYTTRERECLPVEQYSVVWLHYLLGAPFAVKLDHEGLEWLKAQDVANISDRLLRWVEFFSLFDFDPGYIPGKVNLLQDHLSRPTSSDVVTSAQATQPAQQLDLIVLG